MTLQSVKGFKDVLPPQSERAARLEAVARDVFRRFGFRELRLPALEAQDLFAKTTGETTDIVEKEMFLLEDAGGRRLALRPEGTPGVVRAYLQHHLHRQGGRTKLYYVGSMFRAERPQAGRLREFEQIGAECFGSSHPAADAEAVLALALILDEAGLAGKYKVRLNNLGCEAPECRPAFRGRLKAFLEAGKDALCGHCRARIGRNPLRALDCKGDGPRLRTMGELPRLDPCGDCKAHFDGAAARIRCLGLDFDLDPSLVRGLDYYTRTVFEFASAALGAQDALAGGGRYDGLVRSMGGPEVPAVGWALGVERTLLALEAAGDKAPEHEVRVYVAVQTDTLEIEERALALLYDLRGDGVEAEGGLFGHRLGAQLKEADRLKARWAVIFGDAEYTRGACIVKDLRGGGAQTVVPLKDLEDWLKKRLRDQFAL